jgi:SAM-dependent methyltransferase
MSKKQVNKSHYNFDNYMGKPRWASIWHQIDEVYSLKPDSILEIGPGPGIFKTTAKTFGLDVKTLDIAEDLNPDFIASATEMPFDDSHFDVVCAFQMLEHLPFEISLEAFGEMARVAKKNVVISLPDAQVEWPYFFHIPKIGIKSLCIKKPFAKNKEHIFDGEHYWEINKANYELSYIIHKLLEVSDCLHLEKTYRVPENLYHRFFVFSKQQQPAV